MNDLNTVIEKAFDYRGDVTLHLKDGHQVVGYVYNREPKGTSKRPEPFVELMVANSPDRLNLKYSEITRVEFTGEDTAAGKSWEEWMVKEEAKKKQASAKV